MSAQDVVLVGGPFDGRHQIVEEAQDEVVLSRDLPAEPSDPPGEEYLYRRDITNPAVFVHVPR
ncbi:hypothetical protein ACQEU5_22140 [Marinactinospora thermotolerans]|uniref:Uncharacterized protein n=1 Tax=Marinactinospora thermotolerans DSM 45154 TaxID=1122192 RepID=A0A1T4P3A9_9ACTN|nr:hypothetical protein [Marinactinospora thermotolerans]SJZ86100.1 hypothetical protein SAMN02745673_01616 [Marinactinospora thermotolerans DSM 45154]